MSIKSVGHTYAQCAERIKASGKGWFTVCDYYPVFRQIESIGTFYKLAGGGGIEAFYSVKVRKVSDAWNVLYTYTTGPYKGQKDYCGVRHFIQCFFVSPLDIHKEKIEDLKFQIENYQKLITRYQYKIPKLKKELESLKQENVRNGRT